MSEVKRFGRIGDMVEATEGLLKLYPMMSVYVLAEDFDRVTAERDAALAELSEIKESLAYRGSLLCRIEGQRDALQQRLTAADERADALEGLLREVVGSCALIFQDHDATAETMDLHERAEAALKPAEAAPDFRMIGIEKMPPMEFDEP